MTQTRLHHRPPPHDYSHTAAQLAGREESDKEHLVIPHVHDTVPVIVHSSGTRSSGPSDAGSLPLRRASISSYNGRGRKREGER